MTYTPLTLSMLPDAFMIPRPLFSFFLEYKNAGDMQIDRAGMILLMNVYRYIDAQIRYNRHIVLEQNSRKMLKKILLQSETFIRHNVADERELTFIEHTDTGFYILMDLFPYRYYQDVYMSGHIALSYKDIVRLKGRYTMLFAIWYRSQIAGRQGDVFSISRERFRELFSSVADGKPAMRNDKSDMLKIIRQSVRPGGYVIQRQKIIFYRPVKAD